MGFRHWAMYFQSRVNDCEFYDRGMDDTNTTARHTLDTTRAAQAAERHRDPRFPAQPDLNLFCVSWGGGANLLTVPVSGDVGDADADNI
eukprot:631211-Pyramimonas_sp.AAC.1